MCKWCVKTALLFPLSRLQSEVNFRSTAKPLRSWPLMTYPSVLAAWLSLVLIPKQHLTTRTRWVQTLTFWNTATHKQTNTNLFWILMNGRKALKHLGQDSWQNKWIIKVLLTVHFFALNMEHLSAGATGFMCVCYRGDYDAAQLLAQSSIKLGPLDILDWILKGCIAADTT